jgi:hypothetical protein
MGLVFVFFVFIFGFVFDIFRLIIVIFEWLIKGGASNEESNG